LYLGIPVAVGMEVGEKFHDYKGGIFEWALLQEVYGSNFPTEGTITHPLDVYKKID
jgi:hypothetical protein